MKRLIVLCEGPTEAGFANQVLASHLSKLTITTPILVTGQNPHGGTAKGGVTSYAKIQNDLRRLIHQVGDSNVYLTTMLDFYRLPTDFPGYAEAILKNSPQDKVIHLESVLVSEWGHHPQFIPYIQLHEYEALLFSDIRKLDWEFLEDEHEPRIKALEALAATFASPEDIDQGETTAPSKRIEAHLPSYGKQKSSVGPLVAEKIGLPTIRAKCPHFHQWLKRLEEL